MKVHELIDQLKKCDPNTEVVVGGVSISFIEEQPGYYDGHYEIYYPQNPPKFKITRAGKKVKIHTYSAEDALWDYENVEIEIDSQVGLGFKKYIESKIEKIKKQIKESL